MQEFLQVIEKQRESQGDISEDWDMISAFVALGGNPDKTGGVIAACLVVLPPNAYSSQIPRSPALILLHEISYFKPKALLSGPEPSQSIGDKSLCADTIDSACHLEQKSTQTSCEK